MFKTTKSLDALVETVFTPAFTDEFIEWALAPKLPGEMIASFQLRASATSDEVERLLSRIRASKLCATVSGTLLEIRVPHTVSGAAA